MRDVISFLVRAASGGSSHGLCAFIQVRQRDLA
jgi:hypothetical protein